MPIYDFKCEKCFSVEEDVLVESSITEYRCKRCGGFMIRLFTGGSFQLKGSGWYKDGYAKKEAPPVRKE